MPEPISITFGSIGLFIKFFDGFKRAYHDYKLTSAFGEDFETAQRRFMILHTRLEEDSKTKLSWLQDDIAEEGSRLNRAIIDQLVLINRDYETCNKLMKKYHDKEQEVIVALSELAPTTEAAGFATKNSLIKSSPTVKKTQKAKVKNKDSRRLFKLFTRSKKSQRDESSVHEEKESITDHSSGRETPSRELLSVTPEMGVSRTLSETWLSAQTLMPNQSSTAVSAASVQGQVKVAEEYAQQLQEDNNLWRRVKWADHDRDNFYSRLDSLRAYIIDLESLICLRVPQDSSSLLNQPGNWKGSDKEEKTQVALQRLHNALAAINPSKSRVRLDAQVIEDPEKQAYEFSSQDGSPDFEPGSFMFVFQAYLPSDAAASSLFLYAETSGSTRSQGGYDSQSKDHETLEDLSASLSNLDIDDDSFEYRTLGRLIRVDGSSDYHRLFSPAVGRWQSKSSLEIYLTREEFKNKLEPQHRLQLARLLTVSFLHFSKVTIATDQYPRPQQVHYYMPEGDGGMWLNASNEPIVLNPYISIGFGAKRPPRLPGLSSGLAKEIINPVVELGLVLYQIGSSSKIDYGAGSVGFRAAKDVALKSLHNVDLVSNGSYAEIVKLCLGWRGSLHAPVEPQDYIFIDRIRHWLKTQEASINT